VGGGRATVLQCGIDEAAHGASAADDGPGYFCRDCVNEEVGVEACGPLAGFQAAVDVLFPSTAAAASTPWSNSGKTCVIYTTTKKLWIRPWTGPP
jgi:hypothetical protein